MNPGYVGTVAFAIIAFLFLIRRRRVRAIYIQAPKLGFLNLKEAAGQQLLAEDKQAMASIFSAVEESSSTPPRCDVLFIYCDLGADGQISGATAGLRDIIRDSGARIVVVASKNEVEGYVAAAKKTGYGHANLVLTLDRRGEVFPAFFRRLFSEMMKGATMPMAWVKLAPQIPGHDHQDCPGAIYSAEAGQIAFK